MDNTIVLASPRSGSNLLQNTMTDASRIVRGGEFFTGGHDYNIYAFHHLKYIWWYHRAVYKRHYALEIYKKMFKVMASGETEDKDRDVLGPEHLSLLLGFLKKHPQKTWSHSLERYIMQDQLLIKVFYNHYNYENHFDIAEVLEMMDNLILLYRENVLKQFISYRIANKTNVWFARTDEEIKSAKVSWNLEDYLTFYEEQVKFYTDYKKHLSNFSHKKVAIIKYEDINRKNYKQAIRKILQSNDINCQLGESFSIKQSKPIEIIDNFRNPEQFINDQSKIKDKLTLKIEDI